MLPHPLTNFKRQKYDQSKTKLNLMVFIQEIIYLNKGWGIDNKS